VIRYYSDLAEHDGAYEGLGELLFYGDYLIVQEGGTGSTAKHVHIQGETNLCVATYDKTFQDFNKKYPDKHAKSSARPTSHSRKGADAGGFQYMCKEDPPKVVAQRGFDAERLASLHTASVAHRDGLRKGLHRHLGTLQHDTSRGIQALYVDCIYESHKYYKAIDKKMPPNWKMQIKHFLACLVDTREWVAAVWLMA